MHKRDGISATHEMYLKIVYQLEQSGDPARVGQMAKGLGVHPSTVSAVVRTLVRMNLVTHDRYGVVRLTDVGQRLAECVVRRFEVLRKFFTETLGMDPEDAEVEACETEHVVSAETIGRIDRLVSDLAQANYHAKPDYTPPEATMCQECVTAGTCTAAHSVKDSSPS
jgi:DtxR family Mn-dependent transcriptional regulator